MGFAALRLGKAAAALCQRRRRSIPYIFRLPPNKITFGRAVEFPSSTKA
jgi:hypothetical protein